MQEQVYKHHVKDISELRERIVAAWDELDHRYHNRTVAYSSSCFVSKLLAYILSTNCGLLHHISCTYVIAKYRDINTNGYWTA